MWLVSEVAMVTTRMNKHRVVVRVPSAPKTPPALWGHSDRHSFQLAVKTESHKLKHSHTVTRLHEATVTYIYTGYHCMSGTNQGKSRSSLHCTTATSSDVTLCRCMHVCVCARGLMVSYLLAVDPRNAEPMELQLKLISCFHISSGGDQIVTAVYLP